MSRFGKAIPGFVALPTCGAGLSGPEISVRRSWTVAGLVALGQSIGGGLYSQSTTPRAQFTLYSKLPGSFRPICVRRTRREQLADVRNRQSPTIKPRVPIPRAEVASCFGGQIGVSTMRRRESGRHT
jgi:hypothetical protein